MTISQDKAAFNKKTSVLVASSGLLCLLFPQLLLAHLTQESALKCIANMFITLGFVAIPTLWVKTTRAWLLWNTPLFILAAVVIQYGLYFKTILSAPVIQSFFSTDSREFIEKCIQLKFWLVFLVGIIISYIFLMARISASISIILQKQLQALALWIVLLSLWVPFISTELFLRFETKIDPNYLRSSYPVAFIDYIISYVASLNDSNSHNAISPTVPLILHKSTNNSIWVFVIGESTRQQTFNIISSHTNLLSIPEIIYYKDTLAQANATINSIPMLLTGALTFNETKTKPSLIDWQNSAHCKTMIESNNSKFTFASRARITDIQGDAEVRYLNRYDHDMLPIIESIIKQHSNQSICLFIHTIGSHPSYTQRYTTKFEVYPVVGNDTQKARAAYANTVVMVQDFISQLIGILSSSEQPVFMVYTSDHGENLMEINGLREHVTATPTRYELQVPLLFWSNEQYRTQHAAQWAQLKANAHLPVSNANILPTMLDAMDLDLPATVLHGSLMQEYTPPQTRYFLNPNMTLKSENSLLFDANSAVQ